MEFFIPRVGPFGTVLMSGFVSCALLACAKDAHVHAYVHGGGTIHIPADRQLLVGMCQ